MSSVSAFFAVLLFGFLGFCIGTAVNAAEAGGIVSLPSPRRQRAL